jgi:anthranilate synthase/aminodeoxychorismate synthase-like glutamine amidotransferase
MILFIDNYDSFTYNLVDYIGQMESDLRVVRNDQVELTEIAAKKPAGIVISPGPGSPNEAGISCEIIRSFGSTIPILGVCLGFQAIGQVYGAHIVRAPTPVHGKTSVIQHNGLGIFRNIASPLVAGRYHSLIIERSSLPDCLRIDAESDDYLIMSVSHISYPVWGVQFHPESVMTPLGIDLLRNWLTLVRDFNFQHNPGVKND